MSSHFIRLFVFLVVASSCGPQVADPPITLSDEARVNKVGATWFFVSPIRTTYPSNAARFQYAVRVRETTGAFLANPVSKTVTYTSTPTQVEVPIEVKTQVAVGVQVNLVLEVIGMSWNGFDEEGLTFKSQNYTFVTR